MTALLTILLSVAVQASPADTAAQTEQPDTQQQPADPRTADQQPPETEEKEAADPGLLSETARLERIQNEIRELLKDGQSDHLPEDTSEQKDQPHGPGDPAQQATPETQQQPPEVVDAMAAANALYLAGKYADAQEMYGEAGGVDDNGTCWIIFQTANCHRWMGQIDKAIGLYQQLVTNYPDNRWTREANWWITAVQWKENHTEQ